MADQRAQVANSADQSKYRPLPSTTPGAPLRRVPQSVTPGSTVMTSSSRGVRVHVRVARDNTYWSTISRGTGSVSCCLWQKMALRLLAAADDSPLWAE